MPMPNFSEPKHVAYTLPLAPPFFFRGMTARVFPLRGSILAMQRFADAWANIIPPELGWFRAFSPYAFLMMVDYGSLAPDKASMGWLSQREIMFTFPVEQYRLVGGKYVFHDWAWLSPYIYVDNGMSMTLGRTVYGWTKELVQIGPTADEWLQDPSKPLQAARVNAAVFPEVYAGRKQELRPFLEVERRQPFTVFQMPVDQNNPFFPWAVWGSLFKDATRASADMMSVLAAMGFLVPRQGPTPENRMRMMGKAIQSVSPQTFALNFRTLNLKQFRASEDPAKYCYQSLTDAAMTLKSVNRFGLSGDLATLAGDSSGGIGITLYRWASLPIIETLGLETAREWRGDGVDMACLKPVMPFWYDVDMVYQRGTNLAWRTFDTNWHDRAGNVYAPRFDAGDQVDKFNGTLGASNQAVAGPFVYKDAAVRVMPLLARRKNLQDFVDSYLNNALSGSGISFQLWAPPADSDGEENLFAYVYATATSYNGMISETNNVGTWANNDFQLLLPVRWEHATDKDRWGVGLIPVFSYVDRTTAAISASEVTGIPTTQAQFELPDVNWMTPQGAGHNPPQSLLRVNTGVIPAFDQGAEAVVRTIIEVTKDAAVTRNSESEWRFVADNWGRLLRSETHRKRVQLKAAKGRMAKEGGERTDGFAMALAVLAGELPIRSFTIKQYRDVELSTKACYQSLVGVARWIKNLRDVCEIESPLSLCIHEYPSQPIVALLGLVTKLSIQHGQGGVVHELEPIRPFLLRADLREDLGERMAYRCGTEQWTVDPSAGDSHARHRSSGAAWPEISPALPAVVNSGAPRRLVGVLRSWNEEAKRSSPPVTPERARTAAKWVEPQMLVEVTLSREWESWSEQARWSRRRGQLQSQLDDMRGRHTTSSVLVGQSDLFRKLIDEVHAWDFRDKQIAIANERLALLERTSAGRQQMEIAYDELVKIAEQVSDTPYPPKPDNPGAPPRAPVSGLPGLPPLPGLPGSPKAGLLPGLPPLPPPPPSIDESAVKRLMDAVDSICGEIPAAPGHRHYFLVDRSHLDSIAAAKQRVLPPNPSNPPAFLDFIRDLFPGVAEALHNPYEAFDCDPTPLATLFAMARDEENRQIGALLDWLSKAGQKPDFCVLRDSMGPERDKVYPRAQSWDDHWFAPQLDPARSGPPERK